MTSLNFIQFALNILKSHLFIHIECKIKFKIWKVNWDIKSCCLIFKMIKKYISFFIDFFFQRYFFGDEIVFLENEIYFKNFLEFLLKLKDFFLSFTLIISLIKRQGAIYFPIKFFIAEVDSKRKFNLTEMFFKDNYFFSESKLQYAILKKRFFSLNFTF